ncbi:MAG: hypothetical protein IKE52_07390 [Mogibacterium sp.]|nr:hypothetical protein [Mogibacterium sp.]
MLAIKRTAALLVLLLILITTGGCQKMSEKSMITTAEEALRAKYDESFNAVETRAIDDECFYAWLRPSTRPDIIIRAEMNNDGTALSDNYIVKKICHEISDKVELLMKDYSGDYYVFTKNILEYTIDESLDTTPQKHLEDNPEDRFDIVVFIAAEGADAAALHNAIAEIKNLGITNGSINPIVISAKEMSILQGEIESIDDLNSDIVHEIMVDGRRMLIDLSAAEVPAIDELRKELGI